MYAEGHRTAMDARVERLALWWATLVAGLALVCVGFFGYMLVSGSLQWYDTPVSSAGEAKAAPLSDYVRVEGTFSLNASEDVLVVQRTVQKGPWEVKEYNYTEPRVYLEDDTGASVLLLMEHVSTTRPGPHGGDYHKGDGVCVGGYATVDPIGRRAVRVDYLGKSPQDASARFVGYFYAAMFGGALLVMLFVVERLFLHPRRKGGPGWRGT